MSLVRADARRLPIAAGCVQCVVTSPPYWGLRDYGVPSQIGLEHFPGDYVASMVSVFREVWRVLRIDGVVWLNLGDSWCPDGNLAMVPALVALALRREGWIVRSEVVWEKPACLPESVKNRPSRVHEIVYLLAKSSGYYYDADAIAEPVAASTLRQAETVYRGKATKDYQAAGVQNPSDTKRRIVAKMNASPARARGGLTRNSRSVWRIPTQPYAGAHFATMPEDLAERCILAGSRPGDLVLDPFLGSGTVARCAISLGRRAVGTDLNPAYLRLAAERTQVTRGLPLEVA